VESNVPKSGAFALFHKCLAPRIFNLWPRIEKTITAKQFSILRLNAVDYFTKRNSNRIIESVLYFRICYSTGRIVYFIIYFENPNTSLLINTRDIWIRTKIRTNKYYIFVVSGLKARSDVGTHDSEFERRKLKLLFVVFGIFKS